MLQKSGKPVVLCVNKCDGIGEVPPDFYEFYNLGIGDPIAVSSVPVSYTHLDVYKRQKLRLLCYMV